MIISHLLPPLNMRYVMKSSHPFFLTYYFLITWKFCNFASQEKYIDNEKTIYCK